VPGHTESEGVGLEHQVVTVKFLGFLERLAGRREASVEIDEGVTVLDLLKLLGEGYGPKLSAALFRTPNQVQTHLRVFLNEEEASMNDRVASGDASTTRVDLLVLPIFEGGSQ